MSATGLRQFDETLQITNTWLKEIMTECGWEDRQTAYRALRATLHALRDRLSIELVAHLASQMPLLVRGMYYEGWRPSSQAEPAHNRTEFLAPIAAAFSRDANARPDMIAGAVFKVLRMHVSEGELANVLQALPKQLRLILDPEQAVSP